MTPMCCGIHATQHDTDTGPRGPYRAKGLVLALTNLVGPGQPSPRPSSFPGSRSFQGDVHAVAVMTMAVSISRWWLSGS